MTYFCTGPPTAEATGGRNSSKFLSSVCPHPALRFGFREGTHVHEQLRADICNALFGTPGQV